MSTDNADAQCSFACPTFYHALHGHSEAVHAMAVLDRPRLRYGAGREFGRRATLGGDEDDGGYEDAELMVTGDHAGQLVVWDVQTGKPVSACHGHERKITSLAYWEGSPVFVSGSDDHTVRVWNAYPPFECVTTLEGCDQRVAAVGLTASADLVVAASAGSVSVWASQRDHGTMSGEVVDAHDCSQLSWIAHGDQIHSIAVDMRGTSIVTGGRDNVTKKWMVHIDMDAVDCNGRGTLKHRLVWAQERPSSVYCVSVTRSGAFVAIGTKNFGATNGMVQILDGSNGRVLRSMSGHWGKVMSVRFCYDEQWLLSGGDDGTVRMWHVVTAECVRRLRVPGSARVVNQVGSTRMRCVISSGAGSCDVNVFRLDAGARPFKLFAPTRPVTLGDSSTTTIKSVYIGGESQPSRSAGGEMFNSISRRPSSSASSGKAIPHEESSKSRNGSESGAHASSSPCNGPEVAATLSVTVDGTPDVRLLVLEFGVILHMSVPEELRGTFNNIMAIQLSADGRVLFAAAKPAKGAKGSSFLIWDVAATVAAAAEQQSKRVSHLRQNSADSVMEATEGRRRSHFVAQLSCDAFGDDGDDDGEVERKSPSPQPGNHRHHNHHHHHIAHIAANHVQCIQVDVALRLPNDSQMTCTTDGSIIACAVKKEVVFWAVQRAATTTVSRIPVCCDAAQGGVSASHSKTVLCVGCSRNGLLAASGDRNGDVLLWDLAHRERVRCVGLLSFPFLTGVNMVALSEDGSTMATAGRDCMSCWARAVVSGADGSITSSAAIASSTSGADSACCKHKHTAYRVHTWLRNPPSQEGGDPFSIAGTFPVQEWTFHRVVDENDVAADDVEVLDSIEQTGLGGEAGTSGSTGIDSVLRRRRGSAAGVGGAGVAGPAEGGTNFVPALVQSASRGVPSEVTSLDMSASGQFIVVGQSNAQVRVWDQCTGEAVRTFESGKGNEVVSVALSRDARWLLSASKFGAVKSWPTAFVLDTCSDGELLRAYDLDRHSKEQPAPWRRVQMLADKYRGALLNVVFGRNTLFALAVLANRPDFLERFLGHLYAEVVCYFADAKHFDMTDSRVHPHHSSLLGGAGNSAPPSVARGGQTPFEDSPAVRESVELTRAHRATTIDATDAAIAHSRAHAEYLRGGMQRRVSLMPATLGVTHGLSFREQRWQTAAPEGEAPPCSGSGTPRPGDDPASPHARPGAGVSDRRGSVASPRNQRFRAYIPTLHARHAYAQESPRSLLTVALESGNYRSIRAVVSAWIIVLGRDGELDEADMAAFADSALSSAASVSSSASAAASSSSSIAQPSSSSLASSTLAASSASGAGSGGRLSMTCSYAQTRISSSRTRNTFEMWREWHPGDVLDIPTLRRLLRAAHREFGRLICSLRWHRAASVTMEGCGGRDIENGRRWAYASTERAPPLFWRDKDKAFAMDMCYFPTEPGEVRFTGLSLWASIGIVRVCKILLSAVLLVLGCLRTLLRNPRVEPGLQIVTDRFDDMLDEEDEEFLSVVDSHTVMGYVVPLRGACVLHVHRSAKGRTQRRSPPAPLMQDAGPWPQQRSAAPAGRRRSSSGSSSRSLSLATPAADDDDDAEPSMIEKRSPSAMQVVESAAVAGAEAATTFARTAPFAGGGERMDSLLQQVVDYHDQYGEVDVFENSVVLSVLDHGWDSWGQRMYATEAFMYVILLVSFTASTITFEDNVRRGTGATKMLALVGHAVTLLLLGTYVLFEANQIHSRSFLRYFADVWNWIDLGSLLFGMAGMIWQLSMWQNTIISRCLLAAAGTSLYFRVLNYLRGYRRTGTLVAMTLQVTWDLRDFIAVLFIVLCGFSVGFFLLLDEQSDRGNKAIDGFGTLWDSVYTTFIIMMQASADFADSESLLILGLTRVLEVLLVVIISVILLNLLIALMSDSYARIVAKSVAYWRIEQAKILLDLQKVMDPALRQNHLLFPFWLQILRPTSSFGSGTEGQQDDEAGDSTDDVDMWPARVRAITSTVSSNVDRALSRVLQHVSEVENRMAEQNTLLLRKIERLEQELADAKAASS